MFDFLITCSFLFGLFNKRTKTAIAMTKV